MQLQPLQGDDRGCVVDFPLFYPLVSLLPTHHMHPNILVFLGQAVNAFAVDASTSPTRIDNRSLVPPDWPDSLILVSSAQLQARPPPALPDGQHLPPFHPLQSCRRPSPAATGSRWYHRRRYGFVRPAPLRRAPGQRVARRRRARAQKFHGDFATHAAVKQAVAKTV